MKTERHCLLYTTDQPSILILTLQNKAHTLNVRFSK